MALLGNMIDIGAALPAIIGGFKGRDTKNLRRLGNEQQDVANASYNMDSPLFQRIEGQNRDAMQQDLASTIAEISRQNRKLVSMGRTPLLDRERGGETVFRTLAQGREDIGRNSRNDTFRQLQGASGLLSNAYGNAQNLSDIDYSNTGDRVTAYAGLADILKTLFGLNRQPNQTRLQNGETITWNQ